MGRHGGNREAIPLGKRVGTSARRLEDVERKFHGARWYVIDVYRPRRWRARETSRARGLTGTREALPSEARPPIRGRGRGVHRRVPSTQCKCVSTSTRRKRQRSRWRNGALEGPVVLARVGILGKSSKSQATSARWPPGLLGDPPGIGARVVVPKASHQLVVTSTEDGHPRLSHTRDHRDRRSGESSVSELLWVGVVQDAKKTELLTPWALGLDLVVPTHVFVHGLPPTSA